MASKINVLMVGAGEYNCGFVPSSKVGAAPDKKAGVTAIVLFDMRRRGKVGRILLCDAVGTRMPDARATMKEKIGDVYAGMDLTLECFPGDDVPWDPDAYKQAMDTMVPGDAVIVFTPDSTHFAIAMAAIERRLHVLVAKPLVKTLAEHLKLLSAAKEAGVVLATEYHKRWDGIYSDAIMRAPAMGPFSYFYSCMTQRREQLDTFAAWAGKSSDISYYLNSHHIDIHACAVRRRSRPLRVTACASHGVAEARLGRGGIEDSITLLVDWQNLTPAAPAPADAAPPDAAVGAAPAPAVPSFVPDGTTGHAVYMASWAAPTADCHTQQGFHYVGHKGELRVDQAHRGYTQSADAGAAGGTGALAALNPLYMRYVPDALGRFAGQTGYGYRSIEDFVDLSAAAQRGETTAAAIDASGALATAEGTLVVTAILEAGRRSLDAGGVPVSIIYDFGAGEAAFRPVGLGDVGKPGYAFLPPPSSEGGVAAAPALPPA